MQLFLPGHINNMTLSLSYIIRVSQLRPAGHILSCLLFLIKIMITFLKPNRFTGFPNTHLNISSTFFYRFSVSLKHFLMTLFVCSLLPAVPSFQGLLLSRTFIFYESLAYSFTSECCPACFPPQQMLTVTWKMKPLFHLLR